MGERRVHDLGGRDAGPVRPEDHDLAPWERTTNALLWVLAMMRGTVNVDEFRRAQEDLEPRQYESLSYYQRWLMAIENLLVEKGILSREEIYRRAGLRLPGTGGGSA